MTAQRQRPSPDPVAPAPVARIAPAGSLALRPLPVQTPPAAPSPAGTLGVMLLREGLVAPHDMVQALLLHSQRRGRLGDILLARDMIAETTLFDALARHWGASCIDPRQQPPDTRLLDRLGAAACLREGLLPWRQVGEATVI
ncbi:MAG TPA: glycosyl transferase, partial [Paracoccaceae bacterium]